MRKFWLDAVEIALSYALSAAAIKRKTRPMSPRSSGGSSGGPPRGSRASGRPTLAELARIAGVSPITASRALRGVASVGPDLAKRVREAAAALNYVANPAARTLASAHSEAVAVLIPSLSNLLFIDTLEAIHDVLMPRGLEVLIGNFHYSPEEEEKLVRNYLAYQPRGILLTGLEQTPATRGLLAASGIPVVYMMELSREAGLHSVGFSQEESGAAVASHLLARGRRNLAYVAAQLDPRALERGLGFQRVLAGEREVRPPVWLSVPEPSSVALGGELFLRLLEAYPDIDGIFFCNDDLAQGAIFEATRRQIPIPGRVAVVGFNDLPLSAHMAPRLTSIRTPRAKVGEAAARRLVALMEGDCRAEPAIDLGFELVARESS